VSDERVANGAKETIGMKTSSAANDFINSKWALDMHVELKVIVRANLISTIQFENIRNLEVYKPPTELSRTKIFR
jgi:hypothetical protein